MRCLVADCRGGCDTFRQLRFTSNLPASHSRLDEVSRAMVLEGAAARRLSGTPGVRGRRRWRRLRCAEIEPSAKPSGSVDWWTHSLPRRSDSGHSGCARSSICGSGRFPAGAKTSDEHGPVQAGDGPAAGIAVRRTPSCQRQTRAAGPEGERLKENAFRAEGGARNNCAGLEFPFPLRTFPRELARSPNALRSLAGAPLRGLFIGLAELHFTEEPFALHLFLQRAQSLIHIVFTNNNLHLASPRNHPRGSVPIGRPESYAIRPYVSNCTDPYLRGQPLGPDSTDSPHGRRDAND